VQRKTVAGAVRSGTFSSLGRCASASAFRYSPSLLTARWIVSGTGCIYRCEVVTEACPAIACIVNASAPAAPRPVSAVCRVEWSTASHGSPISGCLVMLITAIYMFCCANVWWCACTSKVRHYAI
jgi:hypothetical protein